MSEYKKALLAGAIFLVLLLFLVFLFRRHFKRKKEQAKENFGLNEEDKRKPPDSLPPKPTD